VQQPIDVRQRFVLCIQLIENSANLFFGFLINQKVIVRVDPVNLGLAILAHHNDGCRKCRLEREYKIH